MTDRNPTVEEIIKDPSSTRVPVPAGARYILANNLSEGLSADNADSILAYISRPAFSAEYAIMIMMQACKRDTRIMETDAFKTWAERFASDLGL